MKFRQKELCTFSLYLYSKLILFVIITDMIGNLLLGNHDSDTEESEVNLL